MPWLTVANGLRFLLPIIIVAALFWFVDDRGFQRGKIKGKEAAEHNCKIEKRTMTDASTKYQQDNRYLRIQLANAKRMYEGSCVPVSTTGGHSGNASTGDKLSGKNVEPVRAEALIDFAGDCEAVRLQLEAARSWLKQ